ncbi:MAG: tRNA preQ1(34) S-adenosylmethionine ribosyltransferase-isomerase QueA [Candidatus Hydrothermarchaeota archaeon]|nr:tRNA preQ1(34) S-adenosylmethionine ribosyltransferase-isomerase QueA [Candidatus Hydrothermarchaeota archaeon]
MELGFFDYSLPKELIAQIPMSPRHASRLMVLKGHGIEHKVFQDLRNYLDEGDVLVLNDTKVIPARLFGQKKTGSKVEITLLWDMGQGYWRCLAKGGRLASSTKIYFDRNIRGTLTRENGVFAISFHGEIEPMQIISQLGRAPLPPYIKRRVHLEQYQTVYARHPASVAAPTAGLHFTENLLQELKDKGVKLAYISLHIGLGTFAPVRVRNIADHRMEAEYFEVKEKCCRTINRGKRIIAVGTTTMKALESACNDDGLHPAQGWSSLFIHPPYEFKFRVDALLTNFHLPRSTLLMLVSAYAGRERILQAYREAVRRSYRFYSFGDAMLITGSSDVRGKQRRQRC